MSERIEASPEREDLATKPCSGCKQSKPIDAFGIRKDRNQRLPRCRDCMKAARRAWYRQNREYVAAYQRDYESRTRRRAHLKKYGITPDDFDELMIIQSGACAACGGSQTYVAVHLDVDHCHVTGRVRGLLCRRCNTAIGLAKESPTLLRELAAYLRDRSAASAPTKSGR